MKRSFGILMLSAAVVFSGCELLQKKEDDQSSNEQPKDGGQQGGGAPAMDLTKMVQAPPMIMVGEGAAVGMKIGVKSGANTHALAIVGEDGDQWLVETDQNLAAYGDSAKDQVMGMWVDKKTGKVNKAVLGKKGEAGKEIKVVQYQMPEQKDGPQGEDTEVKLKMGGPYPAKLITMEIANVGTTKSWTGTEGELENVMLKSESPSGSYELKSMPKTETVDCGGTSIETTQLVYDNGLEMHRTENDVIKALNGGSYKTKTSGSETVVTMVATDAKPELKWE
mgnify:CR=1 FL=1